MSSAQAIMGGMEMEQRFNADPLRDQRILSGAIVVKGIRVQDDAKLLIGYDNRVVDVYDVMAVFEHCVRRRLYPPPFDITTDERNRYLETESTQVDSFVWFKWAHKNGETLVSGRMLFKTNSHVGSYAHKATKAATVMGHMQRIRRNCVFEADAVWCCVCKLLELQAPGSMWKTRDLKRILSKKICAGEDLQFWVSLLKVFNYASSVACIS